MVVKSNQTKDKYFEINVITLINWYNNHLRRFKKEYHLFIIASILTGIPPVYVTRL